MKLKIKDATARKLCADMLRFHRNMLRHYGRRATRFTVYVQVGRNARINERANRDKPEIGVHYYNIGKALAGAMYKVMWAPR